MNSLGLSLIMQMGCWCTKETVSINGTKYKVIARIAEGGFSVIDLVQNTTTKKKYALKRIACHSIEDEFVALKEIEISRQLNHHNIIKLVDHVHKGSADIVLNTSSKIIMVLPYFKNGSLFDHLLLRAKRNEHMLESEVVNVFLGICEGLKCFHEAKPVPLAHRDLKTANICFTDSMEPVIVDLGSASEARVQITGPSEAQRLQDQAEERCSIIYRPPELFSVQSHSSVDERTDIWSLGCILYALCYFKNPFDAIYERGDSIALAVISGNINFPENSIYSEELHELILYMMKVNMNERPFIYSVIDKAANLRHRYRDCV